MTGFRPWTYAVTYLLFIPVFGLIYVLLPFHFYHSTTKYEPLFSVQKAKLEEKIARYLQSNYEKNMKPKLISGHGTAPPIIEIFVDHVEYEDNADRVLFKTGIIPLYMPAPEGKLVDTFLTCDVTVTRYSNLRIGPHFFLTQFNYPIEVSNKKTYSKSYPWMDETLLFGEKLNDSYYLRDVPLDLRDELGRFVSTAKGFPLDKLGNLIRMMYFSSVTITTIGYGDIVPVSGLSRILVGLESVLGIVMIGLFINSLSSRLAGGSPKIADETKTKKQRGTSGDSRK